MYIIREYGCCEGSRQQVATLLDEYKNRYLRARAIAGLADGIYYLFGWHGQGNPVKGPACIFDAYFLLAHGDGELELKDVESRIAAVSYGEMNILADQILQGGLAKRGPRG